MQEVEVSGSRGSAKPILRLSERYDEDTSWTTIGSLSTVGELSRDFFNIESTGVDFATFEEIRFRLETTGGVEPVGFSFRTLELVGSTG